MTKHEAAPARRQVDRSAATRELLLDAAAKQINGGGAAQLTTVRVAEEAGLTRGALQHHFPTPHDLYAGVIRRGWEQLVTAHAGLTELTGSTPEMLRVWARTMTAAYASSEVLAAFQLLLARQGDTGLIGRQRQLLTDSERAIDDAWMTCFGEGPESSEVRHILRDTILGGLARRIVAALPVAPEREDMLVTMGLALLEQARAAHA